MNLRQAFRRFALGLMPDALLQPIRKARAAARLAGDWQRSEPDARVVRHLVPEGGVAVDLGANTGIYTKLASELVGPGGHVFSVEPIPLTYEVLRSNVLRFRLANVEPINAAVSEGDGEVLMEVPHDGAGGENFDEARIVAAPRAGLRAVRVSCRSLDSLLAGHLGRIDFIKCDVEGHELRCLRGASALLAAGLPAWMIEVSGDPDDADSNASAVFALLGWHGYSAYVFDGRHLVRRRRGRRATNYFFLTGDHLRRLPAELIAAEASEVHA